MKGFCFLYLIIYCFTNFSLSLIVLEVNLTRYITDGSVGMFDLKLF